MRGPVRLLAAATLVVVLIGGCRHEPVSIVGRVDRLAVLIEPAVDGSLMIRDSISLQPDATDRVRFHRVSETDRADGLEFVEASLDGQPIAPGTDGLTVDATRRGRLVFTWTGEGNRRRDLVLVYRAVSAVAVTEPRATITWPVLRQGRGYEVEQVEASFVLPAGSSFYSGTGMLESEWSVMRDGAGIVARRGPVSDAEDATLVAAFDFNRSGVSDPVWERNLDRQRQFLPAFVAAAIFFLVIGVGTVIVLRMQYPRAKKGTVPMAGDERSAVVHGLRVTGYVGILAALGCALVAATTLRFLGPGLQIIPGSMLLISLGFLAFAPGFRR